MFAFVAVDLAEGKPVAFAWIKKEQGSIMSYAVLPREGWPGHDPQADSVPGKIYDLADCLWWLAAVADAGFRLISDSAEAIRSVYATEGWSHPPSVEEWKQDFGTVLPTGATAEERVMQMLATADDGAHRTAPSDFVPPTGVPVVIHGWLIFKTGAGYEVLTAEAVSGHPHLPDGERMSQSSPLVWIDEDIGWARTQSRIYKLGRKAPC